MDGSDMSPFPDRLSLYYHTASRMRPRQLAGIAERKARMAFLPHLPVDFDRRYERQVPDSLSPSLESLTDSLNVLCDCLSPDTRDRHRRRALAAGEGEVTLLSHTLSFPGRLDWNDRRIRDQDELWWECLFAFEPLWKLVTGVESPDAVPRTIEAFDEWVRDWARTVEIDEPNYLRGRWTPYCVSLRLRHWLFYLAWRSTADGSLPDDVLARAAYKNALFLSNHVEWDVGGNHLIENGSALVVAGVAFDEPRWRRQGLSVLEMAAKRQFLVDGGHFERSPMYHVATLVQYLTVCDLLDRTGRDIPDLVRRAARVGVAFLESLCPPDGRLPRLNDAAHGYTLPLSACLRYADRVNLGSGPAKGWGDERTGYRWLSNDAGSMLVDGGPVGPSHLPGHSHNDLLAVLLWADGRPVLTDTGVYEYEDTEERQYARSVRSHNTVQVGDGEPIPLGGKYLMGRRTRPETWTDASAAVRLFEGRYEGHPAGAPPYAHHREVRVGGDWWAVWDRVEASGPRRVRSRFHLHPDITVREEDPLELVVSGETTLQVHVLGDATTAVAERPYFPQFGERYDRPVVTLDAGDISQARFGVLLTPRSVSDISAEPSHDGSLGTLRLDGATHRSPKSRL